MRPDPEQDRWSESGARSNIARAVLIGSIAAFVVAILIVAFFQGFDSDDAVETTDDEVQAEHGEDRTDGRAKGQAPAANTAVNPSFDVVRISRGGTGVIAGRAAPGSMVDVVADGEVVGTVRADDAGEWVLILEQPLKSGPAELSLVARREGRGNIDSNQVVVLSIPERPDNGFLESPEDGVVAVLTPRSGEGASRILQKPGVAAPGEIRSDLAVETVDYGAGGGTIISGRGEPDGRVFVYIDNTFLGEARVDEQGTWRVTAQTPPGAGEHRLRVDQVRQGGDVELRIEQPFQTGTPLDPEKAESRVIVRRGNTLWHIARELLGSGFRYTMIFQENSELIGDPDLIFPGQVFRLPGGQGAAEDGTAPSAQNGG